MMGWLILIAIIAPIAGILWDMHANPYRIEETVLGVPPRKVFFVYRRGYQLSSEALFYNLTDAEDWIKQAKEAAKA